MTKEGLKATHEGTLRLGDTELKCAVLGDGTRVISRNAVFRAFGRTKRGRAKTETREPNMPSFIDAKNLKPFVSIDLHRVLNPVTYRDKKGREVTGYDAIIIPLVCDVYLSARAAGNVLSKSQEPLAQKSELIVRILSKIAIQALVDEATGYQYARSPDALRFLVEQYIEAEKREWQKQFKDDYYLQLHRLYQTGAKKITDRPKHFARFTRKYVYESMEKGEVLKELDRLNPKLPDGTRRDRLHQHLTKDYGIQKLRDIVSEVTTLMKISPNIRKFKSLYAKANPEMGQQFSLEIDDD